MAMWRAALLQGCVFVLAAVASQPPPEPREITAYITEIRGFKVSYRTVKGAEVMTLEGDANMKVTRAKLNFDTKKFEVSETLIDGVKDDVFKTIPAKGLVTRLVLQGDKIIEIRVLTPIKKK